MKKSFIVFLAAFLVTFNVFAVGCSSRRTTTTTNPNYYCNINLSRTKGQIHKHFSSSITYSSNFVSDPEYYVWSTTPLPPGLSLNTSSGIISGTPSQAGFWSVKVGVRDRTRGTHGQPVGERWYYNQTYEIKIFDKLEGED